MKPLPFALFAVVAAGLSQAAAASHPFRVAIAAGKVGEVCMALEAGDTLVWRFKASTALDFNLHHHVDKQVLLPVDRKAVTEDRAEHAIDQRNDWCLMWIAPADRRATVDGNWSVRKTGAAASAPR